LLLATGGTPGWRSAQINNVNTFKTGWANQKLIDNYITTINWNRY